jgi:hypothetical protein
VLLSEQANRIAWPINDHSEQVENVATQDAHIKRFESLEGGKLAAKNDWARLLAGEFDWRFNEDRRDNTAHTAQLVGSACRRQAKRLKNVGAEHCAIRARVNEKGGLHPRTVARRNFAMNHRAHHLVIAEEPEALEQRKYGPTFPEE